MADQSLADRVAERQRQAGAGVPINITDLVAQHMKAPPGFTVKYVTREEAQTVAEEAWDGVLQANISRSFRLDEKQQTRFNQWNLAQNEVIKARNGGVLNIGASGGQVTFEFTPTGMGTVVRVKNSLTGDSIDLTEY